MQSEIDLAEENEKEAMKKYTDAKAKSNQLAEELIAEKHKANLLAGELNEKDQRLHKLMSERYFFWLSDQNLKFSGSESLMS